MFSLSDRNGRTRPESRTACLKTTTSSLPTARCGEFQVSGRPPGISSDDLSRTPRTGTGRRSNCIQQASRRKHPTGTYGDGTACPQNRMFPRAAWVMIRPVRKLRETASGNAGGNCSSRRPNTWTSCTTAKNAKGVMPKSRYQRDRKLPQEQRQGTSPYRGRPTNGSIPVPGDDNHVVRRFDADQPAQ